MWCLRQVWALFNLFNPIALTWLLTRWRSHYSSCLLVYQWVPQNPLQLSQISMDFSFFPVDAELTADIVELALRKLSRSSIQTRTLSLIYCTIPNCKDTERKFVEKGWIPIAIFSSRCVVDKAGKNNHKRSFRTDLLLGYILMLFLHVCPWKFNLNIVCMLLYGLQVVNKLVLRSIAGILGPCSVALETQIKSK